MTVIENNQIAIIGAGIGGLTLASIMQKYGLKPLIFEREPSSTYRQQGGTLDIHSNTGQLILKEAGLFEKFQSLARYEGQDFRLLDKTGKIYMNEVSDEEDIHRPEIDRSELRKLLLNSIDTDRIYWRYELLEATQIENNKIKLSFKNGKITIVDILIGADGAFSQTRNLLSTVKPQYTGITMVELHLENAKQNYPEIASFNGNGSLSALSDHKGISAQLNGDGSIKVYLSLKVEYEWLAAFKNSYALPEQAKSKLITFFKNWDERLLHYIRYADDNVILRHIYMLPIGHKWERKPGITLLGDAAHLMSPSAGQGANLAMLDAMELALSFVKHSDINIAITEYEEKMFNYSAQAAKQTYNNSQLLYSDNAASKFARLMGD
ncbi:FAD-dependent oxidoreductase [Enterococcus durans]|uniref:FAD-dependent oxidoreductase n=1 Tax=Enterococcus durans TaxID=53345 RepID=UPI00115D0BE4|nr:NAD(P)/FAD-dependent oxidoreductase [Enterococcus durans]EGO2513519.1 FAD-dependent monooxygenase [Enterococcus faecalis]